MTRAQLIKTINTARRALGWDDDVYRPALERFGGVADEQGHVSLLSLSDRQMQQLLEHLRQSGFKARPKPLQDWRGPRVAKLRAMWLALHAAGAVRSADDAALLAWCKRTTGMTRLEWATGAQLNQCVEGLKSWCARVGITA